LYILICIVFEQIVSELDNNKPLELEGHLHAIYKLSSYVTVKALPPHFKNKKVNTCLGKSLLLIVTSYKTHKYIMWANCSFLMFKNVVDIVTTVL
jgi:hypothetical protein